MKQSTKETKAMLENKTDNGENGIADKERIGMYEQIDSTMHTQMSQEKEGIR